MTTIVGYYQHVPKLIDYFDHVYKPPKLYERLGSDRFIGVTTQSFSNVEYGATYDKRLNAYTGGRRANVMSLDYPNFSVQLEARDYDCGLEALIEPIHMEFREKVYKMSWLEQREERVHRRIDANGNVRESIYRDGLRQFVTPVVSIFYRLEDDLANLIGNHDQFTRNLRAGSTFMNVQVGRFDVRIASLTPNGSAPSFEFYVFDDDYHVTRIIGRDLWSYMKVNLAQIAKDFLGITDIPTIEQSWQQRYWESFTPEELAIIKRIGANDAHITRLLYEELMEFLMSIDKHVITRNGLIPKSVASAGERIAAAQAAEEEWSTPRKEFMQFAALTQCGPRIGCRKSGYFENMNQLDQSGQHTWITTQIPGPNSRDITRIPPQQFSVDDWIGKHALLEIRGESFNNIWPDVRRHNSYAQRLQYIYGPFDHLFVTSYEAVQGVLKGTLRVDYIYDGIRITGDPSRSYMGRNSLRLYSIRKSYDPDSIQQAIVKTLAVSPVGKKAETNKDHRNLDDLIQYLDIPKEAQRNWQLMENAFILGKREFEEAVRLEFKQARQPHNVITFSKAFEKHVNYHSRAGAYYDPITAALIYGFSSAMIGTAAYYTNALAWHTDGLITPDGYEKGLKKFHDLMKRAGFPVPSSGMGAFEVRLERAHGWIANGGLYSITGWYTNKSTGVATIETKKAEHGIAFSDGMSTQQIIKDIAQKGKASYQTLPHPTRMMEALALRLEVGTIKSGESTLTEHMNPFITTSDDGDRVWKLNALSELQQLIQLNPPFGSPEWQRMKELSDQDLASQEIIAPLIQSTSTIAFSDGILQDAIKYLANSALSTT